VTRQSAPPDNHALESDHETAPQATREEEEGEKKGSGKTADAEEEEEEAAAAAVSRATDEVWLVRLEEAWKIARLVERVRPARFP
jgi:hypothetical protein